MKKEDYNRYIFIVMIIALVIVALLMISPFARSILSAMIISYVFYPLYLKINRRIRHPGISSGIVVFSIIILISVPLVFLLTSFYGEARGMIEFAHEKLGDDQDIFTIKNQSITRFIDDISGESKTKYSLGQIENKSAEILSDSRSMLSDISYRSFMNFSAQIIDFGIIFFLRFFEIVIIMFMSFFFLKDGPTMINHVKKTFEFKTGKKSPIVRTLKRTINGVIYGILIMAIIQGTVAGIGYYIVSLFGGINNPILWAVLTMFAAVIPTLGTSIIWLPLCIYLVTSGFYTGNYDLVIMGAGLFAYCSLVVSVIDNILSPYIIGGRAELHPVVVLIAILGGLHMFGFIGIVVGPVIFAVLLKLFELHKLRKLL